MNTSYNSSRPSIPSHTRREIEVEAGHKCSVTTCQEHTYLEIHHINGDREDNRKENLILLCDKHHKMAHSGIIDRKALLAYKENLSRQRNANEYVRSQEGDRVFEFLKIIKDALSWNDEGKLSFIDDQAGYWFPVDVFQKVSNFLSDEGSYLRSLKSHDPSASNSQDQIVQALQNIFYEINSSKYADTGGYAFKFIPMNPAGTSGYDKEISDQITKIDQFLRKIQRLMHELWSYTEHRG